MYIYCIFILHNTRPIAWQSICDLRSCKAMTLVRFISLRRHFIYFFSMCFFSFFFFFFLSDIICFRWKWERGLQSSSNDGKDRSTAFDIFHLASLSVSSQVQQCLLFFFLFFFWEYWKYIRYCKRRGTKEHPLHGHATSGGQQTNRRAQAHRPAEPRADGQTMMTKRWRDVPPSSCPREREREMALILAWWHTTGQPLGCECFPLRWGKRKGGRAGGKENEVIK